MVQDQIKLHNDQPGKANHIAPNKMMVTSSQFADGIIHWGMSTPNMLLNVSCLNHAFYHLDQNVRMVKFGSLIQSMGCFFIQNAVCMFLFIRMVDACFEQGLRLTRRPIDQNSWVDRQRKIMVDFIDSIGARAWQSRVTPIRYAHTTLFSLTRASPAGSSSFMRRLDIAPGRRCAGDLRDRAAGALGQGRCEVECRRSG